ncbi:MAG TPA: GapR family DNA-binding domain-containing protein [Rickettsiales bacterium]|nr:GapR family DNA-binding domain-containing protein [Rickettsiales bacterium]
MENKETSVDLKLKRLIENIEKLEEEKKETSRQISDIYKEAKGFGFDTKAMRRIISLRKMDSDKRIELEQLTETYKEALGMLG